MGGKASRQKGTRGESELVELCTKNGIPCQRVIGSGSFIGAKADVKVGVYLNDDGTMPDRDESKCALKGEVKNRKDNPERLWTYLNQDATTKAVFLKRPKAPAGSLKEGKLNEVWMVCLGLSDFIELMKLAYPQFANKDKNE